MPNLGMAKKNGPAPRADGRTAKGTFAPGSAGNKTGRTAVPAHQKSGHKRSDGWQNFFTGQGVVGQDKRSGGFFKADILSFDQMMELAIGDDIAKRACNTIPNEALRQGWDLVISEGAANKIDIAPKGPGASPAAGGAAGAAPPGGSGSGKPNPFGAAKADALPRFDLAPGQPVTQPKPKPGQDPNQAGSVNQPDNDPTKSTAAESEDERVKEIMDKFTALGGEDAIKVCLTWERVFGGAVCILGVNDGQGDLTKPLDMSKVKSIDYLLPLEPREIFPVYGYTDMFAENYGKPEIYRATPRTIWPGKDGGTGTSMFEIHESRLLIFHGEKVSRYQQVYAQNGWGMSIFVPMYRVLRDFNASWAAAGNIVTDFASAVYKFKDLWETLGGDDGAEFQSRLASMNLSRSTINATVIDAEDEFERSSTSVAGLSDLLNQFATRLAAACDMPLTLLFGTSPGGLNATGDSDVRFFYDRVAQYQKDRVLRPLKKLLELVMLSTGDKKIPDKWDVDFRPLWQESAKDKASTMMSQSSADVAWITAGVLSAEEVAAGHWSTGKYNPDITVDFAAREKQEQAVAAPVRQADLDAINPDSPNYKGSQLDPNSSHYVEPPGGPAVPGGPGMPGGAQPKPNPFQKMDANVARRQVYRAGLPRTANSANRNDYSPDQDRDEHGRFAGGAGSSRTIETHAEPDANHDWGNRHLATITASHGLTDKYGAIGGRSKIFQSEALTGAKPFSQVTQPTRNGATHTGAGKPTIHATLEEAHQAANNALDKQAAYNRAQAAKGLAVSAKANGGFTYNPQTGDQPKVGYSVAIHGDREKKLVGKDAITPKAISDYIKDNHDVLLRDPKAHLGGWYNDKDDTWYLDVPHVESDLSKAASLGHDNKQLGIYDLKRGETIEAHEYPEAISKTGRFTGRTDAASSYGSTENDTGGNGGSYEERARQDSRREGSAGRLTFDHIEKRGSKYVVLSEDRSKTLGEYGSEEEAQKRLGQIEYFKHAKNDWSPDQERDARGRFGAGGSPIERAERAISGSRLPAPKSQEPSAGLRAISADIGKSFGDTDRVTKQGVHIPVRDWQGEAIGAKDTQHEFQDPKSGLYTPERQEIHDAYVRDALAGVPKSANQTVYMTGGGPASGKTDGLLKNTETGIPDRKQAAYINADEAKEHIPEYKAGLAAKDPLAASFVHEESADMSKQGIKEAIKAGKDIVYDSTGDGGYESLAQKVTAMRQAGAKRIVANYAVLPIAEAIRRSDLRAASTGRFVPHAVIEQSHKDVSKTLVRAMENGLYDQAKVWDTSSRKPTLVASFDRATGLKIHDNSAWEALKKRGQ